MENEIANEIIGAIVTGVILVIPVWVIHKKAGLSPWLSLLLFIPFFGLLVVYMVLAFSKWPTTQSSQ